MYPCIDEHLGLLYTPAFLFNMSTDYYVYAYISTYTNLEKSTGCICAVLITGLPLAPYMDLKVKLKHEYLDGIRATLQVKPTGEGGFGVDAIVAGQSCDRCLSGIEWWYTQQAHRAVNQGVGWTSDP